MTTRTRQGNPAHYSNRFSAYRRNRQVPNLSDPLTKAWLEQGARLRWQITVAQDPDLPTGAKRMAARLGYHCIGIPRYEIRVVELGAECCLKRSQSFAAFRELIEFGYARRKGRFLEIIPIGFVEAKSPEIRTAVIPISTNVLCIERSITAAEIRTAPPEPPPIADFPVEEQKPETPKVREAVSGLIAQGVAEPVARREVNLRSAEMVLLVLAVAVTIVRGGGIRKPAGLVLCMLRNPSGYPEIQRFLRQQEMQQQLTKPVLCLKCRSPIGQGSVTDGMCRICARAAHSPTRTSVRDGTVPVQCGKCNGTGWLDPGRRKCGCAT